MKDNIAETEKRIIKPGDNSLDIIRKMMFRLLPIQVLFAAVGSVNGLVSSYFATNYVGIDAMTAVGLYNPFTLLIGAVCTVIFLAIFLPVRAKNRKRRAKKARTLCMASASWRSRSGSALRYPRSCRTGADETSPTF